MRRQEPLNIALKLHARETYGHRSGAAIHTQRNFYECVYPDHVVANVEPPEAAQLCRFTADGRHLVCIGGPGMQQLVVYSYTGYSHCSRPGGTQEPAGPQPAVDFHSFFKLKYRVAVASGAEALCKDFCMCLHQGDFLLMASQSPQIDTARQQRELPPGVVDNTPVAESTSFHVVRLCDGHVCSRRTFTDDFIHLHHNAGASVQADLIAVLSIRYQVIHLMQVLRNGDLLDVHHIGPHCSPDDALAISLAEQAEARWRQQQQALQAQQAQQQLAQQEGLRPSAAGSTAAHGPGAGPGSSLPQLAAPAPAAFGPQAVLSPRGGARPSPPPPPLTLAMPPPALSQPLPRPWQHQHQQQQPASSADTQASDADDQQQQVRPLIQGITQRMLAYVYRTAAAKATSDPAAARRELQALYRNFDSFQQLTAWKLQLLDSQHLLVNLGPPLAPGEPQQPAASQQTQFFLVYNFHSTRVLALFRNSSEALLRLLLRHHALFQLDGAAPLWDQLAVAAVHSPTATDALLLQLAAKEDRAECAAFIRRVLAGLPCVSQLLMPSPYLDPRLFQYDDKHVSAVIRPRAAPEHPLKFVLRRRPDRVAFKLLPPPKEPVVVNGRVMRRVVLQLFHPVEPLVVSLLQTYMRPSVLNIYYRG